MTFYINDINKYYELCYVEPGTGVEITEDVIGDSGAIGDYIIYDEYLDAFRISKVDYEWWETYIKRAMEVKEKLLDYRRKYDVIVDWQSAIDKIIIANYRPIDMDDEYNEWQRVFEIIEEVFAGNEKTEKKIIKKIELLISDAPTNSFVVGVEYALEHLRKLMRLYESGILNELEIINDITWRIDGCERILKGGKLTEEKVIELYKGRKSAFKFALYDLQTN